MTLGQKPRPLSTAQRSYAAGARGSYGGTNVGANHNGSARTLLRKQQRQHTKNCLMRALSFAIGTKHACSRQFQPLLANDLEAFRHHLYAGAHGEAGGGVALQATGAVAVAVEYAYGDNVGYSGFDKQYVGSQQSDVVTNNIDKVVGKWWYDDHDYDNPCYGRVEQCDMHCNLRHGLNDGKSPQHLVGEGEVNGCVHLDDSLVFELSEAFICVDSLGSYGN